MKKKFIIPLIIIMIISIINNFYAREYLESYNNYYIKQLFWFILGVFVLIVSTKINLDYILNKSFYLYILGIILLIITLLFGKNINGSKCWINIFGVNLQPSEFMKLFLIIYLRKFTLNYKGSDFKYIIYTLLIVLIPSILTFLEPDTGQVIFYLLIWLVFLVLKKLNKNYYILGISLVLIIGISFFSIYYLKQDLFIKIFGTSFFYRMDRITAFVNNDGYQIENALTSISNSGLTGIKEKIYFPEAATDFAFSMLIANFGIIGLAIFLIVYAYFLITLFNSSTDKYFKNTIFYLLLIQSSINMLMNIGLFPIIGITLPFLSYGGSSIISSFLLLTLMIKDRVNLSNMV